MTDPLPSDFDPQAPFVAQDGLEYEDFAHYLRQEPVDNGRNRRIKEFWQWRHSASKVIGGTDASDYLAEWIWNYYTNYHPSGNPVPLGASLRGEDLPQLAEWRFRAGAERWRARQLANLAR